MANANVTNGIQMTQFTLSSLLTDENGFSNLSPPEAKFIPPNLQMLSSLMSLFGFLPLLQTFLLMLAAGYGYFFTPSRIKSATQKTASPILMVILMLC